MGSEAGWGTHSWNNEPITVYGDDFGLNDAFQETDVFLRFLGQNYRNDIHEEKRNQIIADFRRYSEFYKNEFIKKEKVLSYAFWYYVYNNDSVQKEDLQKILKFEENDQLKNLVDDNEYIESIYMVYDKLNFFNTNKKYSFWFIFWHDLWMNNLLMTPFIENEEYLSPFKPKSICYEYIENKEELIKQLTEKGLSAKETKIRKGWINQTIIDLLYKKLDDLDNNNNEEREIQIQPKPAIALSVQNDIDIAEEYNRASKIVSTICN